MEGNGLVGMGFSMVLALAFALFAPVGAPAMAAAHAAGTGIGPAVMPLAPGREWVYRDTTGETIVRVAARERFAGVDCYRIDWVGVAPFQSEYWQVHERGIFVVGRRVMDRVTRFGAPYLLLRYGTVAGESWESAVPSDTLRDTLRSSVGAEEEVITPVGRFRALPVTVRGKTLAYRRWYASGVGLVKETTTLPDGSPLDEKVLIRWRE